MHDALRLRPAGRSTRTGRIRGAGGGGVHLGRRAGRDRCTRRRRRAHRQPGNRRHHRGRAWPGKGIHYRMHPANVRAWPRRASTAACWPTTTCSTGGGAGCARRCRPGMPARLTAGAGADRDAALGAGGLALPGEGRVLVFALRHREQRRAAELGRRAAAIRASPCCPTCRKPPPASLADSVARRRSPAIAWSCRSTGATTGATRCRAEQREFAHRLIDFGAADVVHGHSSHHPMAIEVHAGKLILYGCGDFINDYEGIGPQGSLRDDVACLYIATLSLGKGRLQRAGRRAAAAQALPPRRRRRVGARLARTRVQRGRLHARFGADGPLAGELVLALERQDLSLRNRNAAPLARPRLAIR